MITDFWYGCAVLKKWGMKESVSLLVQAVCAVYLEGGYEGLGEGCKRKLEQRRTIKRNTTTHQDQQGLLMEDVIDIVHFLWMKSAPRHQESPPFLQTNGENYSFQNVEEWLKTVSL
jgi:hypothetical protein